MPMLSRCLSGVDGDTLAAPHAGTSWHAREQFGQASQELGYRGANGTCAVTRSVFITYPTPSAAARPAMRPENRHPPRKVPSRAR
jgi:hypothetical protein